MEKTKQLIKIGLGSPKMFKRSCWNQAVKVMDFLSESFRDQISRCNKGPGLEKYEALVEPTEKRLSLWALAYKRHIGDTISVTDAYCELETISEETGIPINNARVLDEYFRRHPKDQLRNY